jgi:iron complex transport system substrate-binding protein
VRILSLLPSATEIVFALGLEDALVGVTAECDYPPAAGDKVVVSFPVVGTTSNSAAASNSAASDSAVLSGSAVSPDGAVSSAAQVDRAVARAVASGEPLYRLDEEAIRTLQPDLILAQDLCRVCAVPSGDVTAALGRLGCTSTVLSLDPSTLDDVIGAVTVVAEAADVRERGRDLVASLRHRLDAVRRLVAGAARRRVLELEWSDPPYLGGHWVPEMVEAAGGIGLLARPGMPSPRVRWEDIEAASAEVVVVAPCGYGLARAAAEGADLLDRRELAGAGEVWALDGSAYFSRPGPRVVDGVEALASVLHPGRVPSPPPGRVQRLR